MRRAARSNRVLDPRALVVVGSLAAAALLVTSALHLVRSADRARDGVRYVAVSVEVPLGHIGDALEADTHGEALLQRAVAAVGAERDDLLSQSIAAGEAAAKAWTSYRATALHLPGEAELAAKYDRDYAAGKAIAGTVLVPIIQSNAPRPLPAEQVVAAELDRHDLLALRALYEAEDDAALRSLDHLHATERRSILLGAAALGALVLAGFACGLWVAGRAVVQRRERELAAQLGDLDSRLVQAFEFADDDGDAFKVAARALSEALAGSEVSITIADASEATLTPLVGVAPCGVDSVERCRASRAGAPLQFHDSRSLDTCPVLAAGASEPCAVTCVPIGVAGKQAAVVQLRGPVGEPPELGVVVPLIVRRLGDRITTMRAFARFQIQAARDPLTGLLNRRSFEEAVGRLTVDGAPYAVAFADLDHFKRLNDVHGHDVGDRALRAFAATLTASLRPADLASRWGGEEFVVVLPECGEQEAVDAMDRVRAQLASGGLDGSGVAVTVSVGLALHRSGESFDETLGRADQALHRAKEAGRDRVEVWQPPILG